LLSKASENESQLIKRELQNMEELYRATRKDGVDLGVDIAVTPNDQH